MWAKTEYNYSQQKRCCAGVWTSVSISDESGQPGSVQSLIPLIVGVVVTVVLPIIIIIVVVVVVVALKRRKHSVKLIYYDILCIDNLSAAVCMIN